jgi:3-methyladenine DNA glycosylase AlkD
MRELEDILATLRSLARPDQLSGMARFGINTETALGVRIPELRAIAKKTGRRHRLALALWDTGIHDARILAGMVAEPDVLTEAEMEAWVGGFNSWDLCDQVCSNLFDKSPRAWDKAVEWSGREEEFVRRAGFTLMACLAVHDKKAGDAAFLALLPVIEGGAEDPRNYVRKAVNWALRGIGKRNRALNGAAVVVAEGLRASGSRSARWVGSDAFRELTSDKVLARLARLAG